MSLHPCNSFNSLSAFGIYTVNRLTPILIAKTLDHIWQNNGADTFTLGAIAGSEAKFTIDAVRCIVSLEPDSDSLMSNFLPYTQVVLEQMAPPDIIPPKHILLLDVDPVTSEKSINSTLISHARPLLLLHDHAETSVSSGLQKAASQGSSSLSAEPSISTTPTTRRKNNKNPRDPFHQNPAKTHTPSTRTLYTSGTHNPRTKRDR